MIEREPNNHQSFETNVKSKPSLKRKRNEVLRNQCNALSKKLCKETPVDVNSNDVLDISGEFSDLIQLAACDRHSSDVIYEKLIDCLGRLKKFSLLKSIEDKQYFILINALSEVIGEGAKLDFEIQKDHSKGHQIEIKLKATLVCLLIFSIENMSPTLYSEDCINNVLQYLRLSLVEITSVKKKNINNNILIILKENLNILSEFIRVRNFNSAILKNFLAACIYVLYTIANFEMGMTLLQLLSTLFDRRKEYQALMMNEALLVFNKFPEIKKLPKNFNIGSYKLSAFSVFIMTLIQGSASFSFPKHSLQNFEEAVEGCYENVMKIGGMFAHTFVGFCEYGRNGYKCYRTYLDLLINELLVTSNEPEWPSARLILQLLAKHLVETLKITNNVNSQVKIFALKNIYKMTRKMIEDRIKYSNVLDKIISECQVSGQPSKVLENIQNNILHSLKNKMFIRESGKIFHKIQWFENLKRSLSSDEDKVKFFNQVINSSTSLLNHLDENQVHALIYYLDTKRFNYTDVHVLLNYILHACYDSNSKIKTFGAQYLMDLVFLDADLLAKSVVSKTMNESLLLSSVEVKKNFCALLSNFLGRQPEKATEYNRYFLKFLNEECVDLKIACISSIKSLLRIDPHTSLKKELCFKIMSLIREDDTLLKKQVVDFCNDLWLTENQSDEHLETLFQIIDMPNAVKYFLKFLEEKSQNEVDLKVLEIFSAAILEKIKVSSESSLPSFSILAVIASVQPNILKNHVPFMANHLLSEKPKDMSEVNATVEVLHNILSKVHDVDSIYLEQLRKGILEKLSSSDFLHNSVSLVVIFLKLLKTFFIEDNEPLKQCFISNFNILDDFKKKENVVDNRIVARALKICIYLHKDFPKESEDRQFLSKVVPFLESPIFASVALHSFAHLSIESKEIIEYDLLKNTIIKHLRDRGQPVMTQAALYNVLCYLRSPKEKYDEMSKNVKESDSAFAAKVTQMYLNDILQCAQDRNSEVRYSACLVINYLVKICPSPEYRLLPFIVTMSTDHSLSVYQIGSALLKQIKNNPIWDLSYAPQKSLLLSHYFHHKLAGNNFIRGFVEINEKLEARCNLLYVLIQDDSNKCKIFINSLFRELQSDSLTNMLEKLYIIDHFAYFTYKSYDEVMYVLHEIEGMKSYTLPDEKLLRDSLENKKDFVTKYYGYYLMVSLKEFLQNCYGIKGGKFDRFYLKEINKEVTSRRSSLQLGLSDKMLPKAASEIEFFENMYLTLKSGKSTNTSQSNSSREALHNLTQKALPENEMDSPKLVKGILKTPKNKAHKENSSTPESASKKITFASSTPKLKTPGKTAPLTFWFTPTHAKKY